MEGNGLKLAFMGFVGMVFVLIGLTGKLGSILGAIIDPANMQDTSFDSGGGSNGTGNTNLPKTGTLSATQIKAYAKNAGFSGDNLVIATAIALAESGGNTQAVDNDANGTTDRGLWQINSVHAQFSASQLFDPAYNAKAAYQISGGSNWYPWVTFTTGAYLKYMNTARNA